jgi:uncharacterized protein (TIGR03067 family)
MQVLPWLFFLMTCEVAQLGGNWKVVGLEANGQAVPKGDFKNVTWNLVIKNSHFKYAAGALVIKGTFRADGRHFDAEGRSPDGTTFEIVGTYQQEGNRLKLCLDLNGRERPREFKTTPGSNAILLIFKREKP